MLEFDIDLQSRTPIYEQIYKKILELIIKGVLSENDQIPSVRVLSKQISINPNTIAKAYTMLERDGIIYSLSGRGSFVARIRAKKIDERIFEGFDRDVCQILSAGVKREALAARLKDIADKFEAEELCARMEDGTK